MYNMYVRIRILAFITNYDFILYVHTCNKVSCQSTLLSLIFFMIFH